MLAATTQVFSRRFAPRRVSNAVGARLGRWRVTIICNDGDYFLRHRRITVDALARDGHTVRVVAGGLAVPPEPARGWTSVHVPIERYGLRPWTDAVLVWRTLVEIVRHKPDTLHLITLKPIVVSGLAALFGRRLSGRRLRIVATMPGLGRLMSPDSSLRGPGAALARGLTGWAVRWLAHRRDVYFSFETHADRAAWLGKGLIRAESSVVISGAGVDPAQFHPPERRSPSRRLRVLFASRLLRSKGLDVFLEAARAFRGRDDVEFLVAGMVEPGDPDGVRADELRREPAISFLGMRTDMPELLRAVDVVCLPTRYGEGIPRVLIEATATGVACIASDGGGCRDIVEDGCNGVIIPKQPAHDTAEAIAAAVRGYLADPELVRRHGKAGRRKFQAGEFVQDKVVAQFVRLIVQGQGEILPAGELRSMMSGPASRRTKPA